MNVKLLQTSDHNKLVNSAIVKIQQFASAVYGAEAETTIAIVRAANEELKNIPTVEEYADNIVAAWFDVISEYDQKIAQSNARSNGWLNSGN